MFISGNFSNKSFVKTGSIVDSNVELIPEDMVYAY